MAIHVEEAALSDLRQALETAGEDYKNNLAKLTNLITEITSGHIQGDPATDLLNKFNAKEAIFKNLANTIDKTEKYMGMRKDDFGKLISDLASGMR